MKARSGILIWGALVIVSVVVVGGILISWNRPAPAIVVPAYVEQTRQELRAQGFKTDLSDFDLSTSDDLRAREYILKAALPNPPVPYQPLLNPPPPYRPFLNPNLMETVGKNSVIVFWKQTSIKNPYPSWPGNDDEMTWDEFCQGLKQYQQAVDATCEAVLSGPIQFNLQTGAGGMMLLPHLAVMKTLTVELNSRTMFALHGGDLDGAWTNLMAATRLVTAWNTEPVEISHVVRFADTELVFDATWQALQTNAWSDDRLVPLQREWESVNFFTNLPEVVAFGRASDLAALSQSGRFAPPPMSFGQFLQELLRPAMLQSHMKYRAELKDYEENGRFEDEKGLMLFSRDREIEMQNAIKAPTWMAMQELPGVANPPVYQSKFRFSPLGLLMQSRAMNMQFQMGGTSFLGRAAKAEAQRRLMITAIALQRYYEKHDAYPETLAALVPEFLGSVPLDFIDGQPLRYRLGNDDHFLLYSIGLDGVDHGGEMPTPRWERPYRPFYAPTASEADIVWPLPASAMAAATLREQQEQVIELQNYRLQQNLSKEDWRQSALRQSRAAEILAAGWTEDTNIMESFRGQRVVDLVGNLSTSSTNSSALGQLLTPKQIITGDEPEQLTFQVPVKYDAVTNMGGLTLLVDADRQNPMGDTGARIQDCNRAANGDCLLVWHAIFDPPGRHAVQVGLELSPPSGGIYFTKGPPISVTTSNFCQFSLDSATYDIELGETFQARVPDKDCNFTIECVTTNGAHLKTLSGSTTNGEFSVRWNLVDDHGGRLHGETFNSIVHINLPDSGRSQTLHGP